MSTGSNLRERRSVFTLICVLAVVAWTSLNAFAAFVLGAQHKSEVVQASNSHSVVPIIVAVVTALAYILTVRRAPSTGRWIWCWIMVALMALVAVVGFQPQKGGVHVYTIGNAVSMLVVGLIIAGPLLWFYLRPAKAAVARV